MLRPLFENPSPRLKRFLNQTRKKMSLQDSAETFRDWAKIFRDPRFSGYHSPPLLVSIQPVSFEQIETEVRLLASIAKEKSPAE